MKSKLVSAHLRTASVWPSVSLAFVLILWPMSGATQVQESWLKRNCLDKGTADHPLHGREFEACLRKQIDTLPPLDKSRRELFGEQYDPKTYVECRLRPDNRNNSACNVYTLRRREWPEYWPEGAKRITWPDAPKESIHRRGMTPTQYWQALCKAEAGEFVFETVDGVKSIYNVRPRGVATDMELADRYVLEDPFSYTDVQRSHNPEEYFVQPYLGHYLAYEVSNPGNATPYMRYFRSDKPTGAPYQTGFQGRWVKVPYLVARTSTGSVSSRYGIVWRGIVRPRDRENGIAGGEFVIADLATGRIVGFRRGFALSGSVPNRASGFWWLSAERCPAHDGSAPNMVFVRRVLKPIPDINAAVKPLE